jgi:hypothetical protein
VDQVRGKSYLAEDVGHLPHTAASYLQKIRDQGVAVNVDDPPWDDDWISQCTERGPHPSAAMYRDLMCDEYADFIKSGFWVVLPLEQVLALKKDVRFSPLAVKDEQNWQPRVLVDHTYFGVNEHTIKELPSKVMQFGGALARIMWIL